MELNKIQNNTNKFFYNNLLKISKKKKLKLDFLENKINDLDKDISSISETEILTNNKIIKEIVYSDDYLYKKPWTRISEVHKIIKVKEFVNKLQIIDQNNKEFIESKIISLIKSKILTKKDKVIYDKINGKIISIPDLSFNKGKYNINLK
jgi:hypothetical protein